MDSIRLTVAQAVVKFLDNQYIEVDGRQEKFVRGIFTIFGHGNVVGLGQALEELEHGLEVYQGKNEQGMAHIATAFAKQKNRQQIYACTSSVGPGAANMVTAAATATANNIPVLLLPGDVFATWAHAVKDLETRGIVENSDAVIDRGYAVRNLSSADRVDALGPLDMVNPLDIIAIRTLVYAQLPTA